MSELRINISKNNTICGCEGSIAITTKGGTPPYLYSINGGLTYTDSPLFTNLCEGLYIASILDGDENIVSDTVTINPPSNPITYFVSLNTTSSVKQNNGTILTKEYRTNINITPPLPDGVILNLDLVHTNTFKVSPTEENATNTTTSILYKNGEPVKFVLNDEITGNTNNTIPGCQDRTIYIKSIIDNWSSLQMVNTDNLLLITTTTINRVSLENCYVATSEETYSLNNLSLFGCNCCNVISG